jgi:2-polyprenyl-3-methyl-5-hydroxy-6-metoxy-1,4-benzoquinol methylase
MQVTHRVSSRTVAPSRTLGERILLGLSREPGTPDYPGGTLKTNMNNSLDYLLKTVPGFLEIIRGKSVLDFGCGWGWQAVAMVRQGARFVVGIDIVKENLEKGRVLAKKWHLTDHQIRFVDRLDTSSNFDVVLSCGSFEHFSEPETVLRQMCHAALPSGTVIISFAEPWYSAHGSHMDSFTRLPWVNILFSEKTVMKVRQNFRDDAAKRYEDVQGGLNRMTLAKFEKIIHGSGMKVEWLRYYATKNLPLVIKLPVLREVLTSAVACILRA